MAVGQLGERGVLRGEYVVGEYPGQAHLDGELAALAHRHLEVELAVPQLRQVARRRQRRCSTRNRINQVESSNRITEPNWTD